MSDIKKYDDRKWNSKHINKTTNTYFDEDGYDFQGYDIDGFDKDGYNRRGFNKKGIHRDTGMKYDKRGYDINYRDRKGRFRKVTLDNNGFNSNNIHILTGTRFGPDGFNKEGYDKEGYDRDGYNRLGYDRQGYDRDGIDKFGFNKDGISAAWGYDKEGYYPNGFNFKTKINKYTGTQYDKDGYDINGYNANGIDREGFNRFGRDKDGYFRNGFNNSGIHKDTKTAFNPDGISAHGFKKDGTNVETCTLFDRFGFDIEGYDENGFNKDGYDREGYDVKGFNKFGINREGINKETGEKDSRVLLAEEFINYGKSINEFALAKTMNPTKLHSLISQVRNLPFLKPKIDEILNRNSKNYLAVLKKKKQNIFSGKLLLRDTSNVEDILNICSEDEKHKLEAMIVEEISSHSLGIMQYVRMFNLKPANSKTIDKIDAKINAQIYKVTHNKKYFPGNSAMQLRKEQARLNVYKTPYKPSENEKVGYMKNPNDRQPVMFSITDEHRQMAKEYLNSIDEYICGKTMRDAFFKIAKGELNQDIINRLKKESKLREAIIESNDLDLLIDASRENQNSIEIDKKDNSEQNL